jgi:single-stranded DNA-binding protein
MLVKLEGNVCQDVKKVSDKLSIIRLAENFKRDKNSPEQTIYWDIKVFERCQSDLDYFQIQKGDKLLIDGKLIEDEFEKEGVMIKKFAIIADSIKKIWRRPSAANDSKF